MIILSDDRNTNYLLGTAAVSIGLIIAICFMFITNLFQNYIWEYQNPINAKIYNELEKQSELFCAYDMFNLSEEPNLFKDAKLINLEIIKKYIKQISLEGEASLPENLKGYSRSVYCDINRNIIFIEYINYNNDSFISYDGKIYKITDGYW